VYKQKVFFEGYNGTYKKCSECRKCSSDGGVLVLFAARGELRAEYSKNDFMEGFIFLTKGSAMLSLFYLWDL